MDAGAVGPCPGDRWTGATGFIHDNVRAAMQKHPAPEDCEYYLCGPPVMISAVLATLARLGVEVAGFDAAAMPTAPILPPSVERLLTDDDYYKRINLMALRNTRIGNLLGLSSLTLPLPEPGCGLMLFGKPFGEGALCRLGAAAEKALA
mgnify:CR=1 FL=1